MVASTTLALLDAVRAGEVELDATAHPLGFIHAPLAKRVDGSQLRLHLWPADPFEPQSPAWFIHRHAWPLRSNVVQGKICDRRYRVLTALEGSKLLYETAYEDGCSVLKPTGRTVSCELLTSSIEAQESLYVVPPNAFHASEALEHSVTVAESGKPSGIPPLVVGDRGEIDISYRRRTLAPNELCELVSQIIA